MSNVRNIKPLPIIILVYALLYSLISLVNHYLFRTFALDLGLYTQALYKYAHFHLADSTMIKTFYEPLLGGHFDLYLIIFSPLVYVFGTYTLLVVQIAAVLFGGVGVYKYFSFSNKKNGLKNNFFDYFAVLWFYSFFGIFAALSYDYHSVLVASSILPWFFLFIKQKKFSAASVTFIFILISQENLSLLMFFVCLGLLIEYRKEIDTVRIVTVFSILSIIYFISIIYYVIPAFSSTGKYGGFLYSVLGSSPLEAFKTIITHPLSSIKILFVNHTHNIHGDYVKLEFHLFVLLSGLYLLIKKPVYLLMLVPLYAQKMYHNSYTMWSIDGQYTAEFAPILAIGIFTVLSEIKNKRTQRLLLIFLFIGTIGTTIRLMDHTHYFTEKSRIRFYQSEHYHRNYNVKEVYKVLNTIPQHAKVSALSPFVPHLALRNYIYQFPLIKDAQYIVYNEKENCYPLTRKKFNAFTKNLANNKNWNIYYKSKNITVLKKSP